MAKPTSKPDWTVGNVDFATVTQEPTALKKQAGWLPNEKPPREFMNWLFYNLHEWIEYFEVETDTLIASAKPFDFIVGSGTGMTADLATAVSSANAGDRILVTENDSIDSVVQVNKALEIYFQPGVTYSKGAATSALEISADGVVIRQGRFTGFNGGSDVAIQILNTASHVMIRDCRFASNTESIDDQGINTTIEGLVNEDANEKNTDYVFSLDNNQSVQTALTDLDFDSTYTKNVCLYYTIHRRTDSAVKKESGFLVLNYDPDAAAWDCEYQTITGSSGVEFFITAGQVEYTSDNMSGASYEGELKLSLIKRFDV